MPQYRVTLEEAIFADMNRNNTGLIDWWEYLIPMCVRKLSERKKVSVLILSIGAMDEIIYLGFSEFQCPVSP